MLEHFPSQHSRKSFELVLYSKCVDKQLPLLSGKSLVFVSIAQTPDSSGVSLFYHLQNAGLYL